MLACVELARRTARVSGVDVFCSPTRSEVKGRVCEGSEGGRMETAGLPPCENNTALSVMTVIFYGRA